MTGALALWALRRSREAAATTAAFFADVEARFEAVRREGEGPAVWAMVSGTTHGALGVSSQRVLLFGPAGLRTFEKSDVAASAVRKNLGGARLLWGYELELCAGPHTEKLVLLEAADFLPPQHDAAGVLARLAGAQ